MIGRLGFSVQHCCGYDSCPAPALQATVNETGLAGYSMNLMLMFFVAFDVDAASCDVDVVFEAASADAFVEFPVNQAG